MSVQCDRERGLKTYLIYIKYNKTIRNDDRCVVPQISLNAVIVEYCQMVI